jgi:hypothetical protein
LLPVLTLVQGDTLQRGRRRATRWHVLGQGGAILVRDTTFGAGVQWCIAHWDWFLQVLPTSYPQWQEWYRPAR